MSLIRECYIGCHYALGPFCLSLFIYYYMHIIIFTLWLFFYSCTQLCTFTIWKEMFTWGILPLCLLLTWVINEVKMHYHWNMVYPLSVKSTDNNFQYIPSGVMEKDDALYRIMEYKDRYERIKTIWIICTALFIC